MLFCGNCGKEVSIGSAILARDFYSRALAFCSVACQSLWNFHMQTSLSKQSAESATNGRQN
jgi:hypothetical protein